MDIQSLIDRRLRPLERAWRRLVARHLSAPRPRGGFAQPAPALNRKQRRVFASFRRRGLLSHLPAQHFSPEFRAYFAHFPNHR